MRTIHLKLISFSVVLGMFYWLTIPAASAPSATAIGPRQSGPIALTADNSTLVNVNPEANTISVFDTSSSTLVKLGEVKVGRDPESVAVQSNVDHGDNGDGDVDDQDEDGQSDGALAYVANSFDGTVSVVSLKNRKVKDVIKVGAEPSAVALSPNGTRLYVANSSSNNLMVSTLPKKPTSSPALT
jgi:YVTN family beta-propeller protein